MSSNISDQVDVIEGAPPPTYVDQPATRADQLPDGKTKDEIASVIPDTLPEYAATSDVNGDALLELVLEDVNGRASVEGSPYYVPFSLRRNPGPEELQERIIAELGRLSRDGLFYMAPDTRGSLTDQIITAFFAAISCGSIEIVERVLDSDLLDANTPAAGDDVGMTPLLCAIQNRQSRLISLLISKGAFVDTYGTCQRKDAEASRPAKRGLAVQIADKVVRTPLQLAASVGNLPMVKILMEQFSADDALIAPDGQIALRLAAENGHREVAAYLPLRRGGGYLRWKTKHRKFVRRMKKGAHKLGSAAKFAFYTTPKFFCYTFPKWVVTELAASVRKSAIYIWNNKHKVVPWCKALLKICWKTLLETPRFVKELFVEIKDLIIRIFTVHIPKIVTVHIPRILDALFKAFKITTGALWSAIKWVLNRTISFFHTLFEAIASGFRWLTWKNIWAAFRDILQAIFVDFPKALVIGVRKAGYVLEAALKSVFGCLYYLAKFFVSLVLGGCAYIMKQIWRILSGVGGTTVEAGREIRVWFNPKA